MVAALRHPLVVERPVEVQRLTGPDRNSFLHGLLTADVKALPADGVVDAAMCDGKGNALEVLTVVSRSDALLALGAGGRGATLGALLDKYLFPADRVELSDESAEWRCYEVLGPHADAVVSEAFTDSCTKRTWRGKGHEQSPTAQGAEGEVELLSRKKQNKT